MSGSSNVRSVFALYALALLSWSGAWFALKLQAGVVSPLVSVALRFLLAAPLIFILAALRGEPLRYGWRTHAQFALMGLLMFSINFIFAYNAAMYLTSALGAVVFSLSAGFNLLLIWALKGQRPTLNAVAGSTAGTAGLMMLMWTEVSRSGVGHAPLLGVVLALGMTLSFCFGNVVSANLQQKGMPIVPTTAWAMTWGGLLSLVAAVATGQSWVIDLSFKYLGSLAFLVTFGTVIGFLTYLTLIARVGTFRAAYVTVLVPFGAFFISSLFENYHWTPLSFAGLIVSAMGNVLVLRGNAARRPITPQPRAAQ